LCCAWQNSQHIRALNVAFIAIVRCTPHLEVRQQAANSINKSSLISTESALAPLAARSGTTYAS
jgi:hypothetical protein